MKECPDCASRATEIARLKQIADNLRQEKDNLARRAIGAEARIEALVRRYGNQCADV